VFPARKYAEEAIAAQMACFQRWGVMGDWEHPYCTFQPQYEAAQIALFARLHEKVREHCD